MSNKTVAAKAGCERRSVTTARAILVVSGYGIEVRRGSGSPGKPSHWLPQLGLASDLAAANRC